MIGTILSLHYIGKKAWMTSIMFWLMHIVAVAIITSILGTTFAGLALVVYAGTFMALAFYWQHIKWIEGFKLLVIAIVIDIIAVVIIVTVLGITLLGYVSGCC